MLGDMNPFRLAGNINFVTVLEKEGKTMLENFIKNSWDKCIRYQPEDDGTLIGLPKPYTVPCIEERFQEMYYWDTYFTNLGLLCSNRVEQAKNNAENMSFLIHKYGFMPNGNRTWYLTRSQPPFFSKTVRDIFDITNDKDWLNEMYPALIKEYNFFKNSRMLPSGLFRYYGNPQSADAIEIIASKFAKRVGITLNGSNQNREKYAYAHYALCESGWDCNSRFGVVNSAEFSWIDLNSLIYGMLTDLTYFAEILQNGEDKHWQRKAEQLQNLICEKCYDDEKGMFCDYDLVNEKKSNFLSLACFYPLYVGLSNAEQAEKTIKHLIELEQEFGVACCPDRDDLHSLQWDYPIGWACLHQIVVKSLLNYGYKSDAHRIAKKFCKLIETNYAKTGNLWEKYNVVTGGLAQVNESHNSHMMGWTAGCYLYCLEICKNLEA